MSAQYRGRHRPERALRADTLVGHAPPPLLARDRRRGGADRAAGVRRRRHGRRHDARRGDARRPAASTRPWRSSRSWAARARARWRTTRARSSSSTCGRRGASRAATSCRCSSARTSGSRAQGATVLGIDVKENSGAALEAVREFGLTYPNLRDPDGTYVREFGQTGYPETYVLDRAAARSPPCGASPSRASGSTRRCRRCWRSGRDARRCSPPCSRSPCWRRPPAPRTPRASLPDIEDEVMCLECGTALNVSTSAVADQERAFIRELIAQGLTKEQVKAALVDGVRPARARASPRSAASRSPPGWSRCSPRSPRSRSSSGSPAAGGAPRGRRAERRGRRGRAAASTRPTRAASTPSWPPTTGERTRRRDNTADDRRRRHHRAGRLRGRLRLVHLALRAAARARLPVGRLRRERRRAAAGRALARGRAAARDRLLPLVHRRLRRARA